MSKESELLELTRAVLGSMDHRQSFSPGMFDPLMPICKKIGYGSFAVYIADDYPDRMRLVSGYGQEGCFPSHVAKGGHKTLLGALRAALSKAPGLLVSRLYSHGRELGAIAALAAKPGAAGARDSLEILARTMSVMAYVERIRTNDGRERQERDIFFAQSLTNRLLVRDLPKVNGLRLGVEFIRSLEAGGDFFDVTPTAGGGLLGFVGCCSGNGLRTVLEVASIMRETFRAHIREKSLAGVLLRVNDFLVKEKRRAHQASMCMFEIDIAGGTLRLAKAGRLGLLLCGPGAELRNVSAHGGLFLGMVGKPRIRDEVFAFDPGQALFCVTEGFYTSRNCLNVTPQLHWFMRAVEATLELKRKAPLANAVFDNLNRAVDQATRPGDSMLALSVERTGKRHS